MAQQQRQNKKQTDVLPFGKKNLQILFIALIMIVLGYVAMAQPPFDSFLSMTVAPILLLSAFLVVIPYSIFYGHFKGKKSAGKDSSEK
jgi:uncharacterized membrane protein HdeD (DUF308 family)